MYPLNVTIQCDGVTGHAVANDTAEHQALSAAGYLPALAEDDADDQHTIETARAALDAAGIAYDGRHGLTKLLKLLPA